MPTIKIVPMPGVSVPGPAGPIGLQGIPGNTGPAGPAGTNGTNGLDGEDALWNFTGAYSGGASYAVGDVVTYDGQLWYRANSNGGNTGDTPSEGFIWDLLAAKGADGSGGSGGLAYLGDYVSGNGYVVDLAVVRGSDNNLYIAKSSGALADPVGNTAEWDMFSNNATSDLGNFQFNAATANVNNSETLRIESRRFDGTQASALVLDPGDPSASLSATQFEGQSFSELWTQATWSGETVDILDTPEIINFLNGINSYASVQRVIINESAPMNVTGLSWTPTNVQLGVAVPAGELTPITDITFIYAFTSQVRLDYDNNAIDISGNRMNINLTTTQGRDISIISSDDATLRASGDDLNLHAGDDIRFISSWDNADHSWTMDSEGRLQLPGNGYIENPEDSSGDGYQNDTIKIVPDGLLESDQYLIIDPTAPNHIHLRAGGTQDASSADIFLGAEYTNVQVSDSYKSVYIRSKQQGQSMAHLNINPTQNDYLVTNDVVTATSGWTVDVNGTSYYITAVLYDNPVQGNTTIIAPGAPFVFEGVYNVFSPVNVNQWTFAPDGTFQGPAMGGVKVLGLLNSGDNDLGLYANDADIILQTADGAVNIVAPEVNITSNASPSSLNINTYSGAIVNSNRTSTYAAEDKVVATLGDIKTMFPQPVSWTPEVSGTGFTQTSNPATGTYLKYGSMVVVNIFTPFTNVTNFGSGQYSVTLPFPAKNHADVFAGSIHNTGPTTDHYSLKGHLVDNSSVMTLWYISGASKDEPFDHNSPITLNTTDLFHMHFIYEIEE
jgi:hypothetical protein